jgi:hypothetical protein
MSASQRTLQAVLVASMALVSAGASAQQPPRLRVALDVRSHATGRSQSAPSESMLRRIQATLIPAIEQQGYQVIRVQDWNKANHSGLYEAVIRLDVDARRVVHVSRAVLYDKDQAPMNGPRPKRYRPRYVDSDVANSVEAWAAWKTWDGKSREDMGSGSIGPLRAQVEGSGASATLEDEDNLARLMSDDLAKAILPAVDRAVTPVEAGPR